MHNADHDPADHGPAHHGPADHGGTHRQDGPRAPLSPTPRSTLTRKRDRAATDRAVLDRVLDDGLVCHLGVVLDGAPVVLPLMYGRDGDTMYLHGSTGARSLRAVADGAPVCVTVTHVDAVVYARSLMHHSMNYRSAVVHGRARVVLDETERTHGLRVLTEHAAPGAWDYARLPTAREAAATMVLALDLTEASVKVRDAGPVDDPADVAAGGVWAGVLPLRQAWGRPVPADDLQEDLEVPAHVAGR